MSQFHVIIFITSSPTAGAAHGPRRTSHANLGALEDMARLRWHLIDDRISKGINLILFAKIFDTSIRDVMAKIHMIRFAANGNAYTLAKPRIVYDGAKKAATDTCA